MARQDNQQEILRQAANAVFENLEKRVLMSVSFLNGKLKITGSNDHDKIVVYSDAKDSSVLGVAVNGEQHTFTAAKVKKITVEAGRGDDRVTLGSSFAGLVNIPATIYGGKGNDTVNSGAADDILYGGPGKDLLYGNGGTNKINDEEYNLTTKDNLPVSTSFKKGNSGSAASPFAITVPTYTVIDLGTLPGGLGDRIPYNIENSAHHVVGFSTVNDASNILTPHAFFKQGGTGRPIDLGTLGGGSNGTLSRAYDVNNLNQVVGVSNTTRNGPGRAFLYDGIMRDLGPGIAWGMNDVPPGAVPEIAGEVGGAAVRRSGARGTWINIPNWEGGGNFMAGRAREVNNLDLNIPPNGVGDIYVGGGQGTGGDFRAFVYDEVSDTTINIGVFERLTRTFYEAFDVNNDLDFTVVGTADYGNTATEQAFWWRASTDRVFPLATPVGALSRANGVRDTDPDLGTVDIVGRITLRNNNQLINHAALWLEDPALPVQNANHYRLIDLQNLTSGGTGRVLEEAYAISNDGWIVASGTTPFDRFKHAFLLRPGNLGGSNPPLEFSGNFTKGINSNVVPTVPNTTGQLVFNIFGAGDFAVAPTTVTLDLLTIDLQRNNLPSEGILSFNLPPTFQRWVTSTRKGTGEFSGRATVSVTLNDGTFADLIVAFSGDTWRKNKKDFISGDFVAISSRGKVLLQGVKPVLKGSFGPP